MTTKIAMLYCALIAAYGALAWAEEPLTNFLARIIEGMF